MVVYVLGLGSALVFTLVLCILYWVVLCMN